jgi:LmbE family N-acetylglucosaminyl deacetylase
MDGSQRIPDSTPLTVISPHLDDAVFSCGQLLTLHPNSTVVTVFAGRPPVYRELTAWDEASGFRTEDDVVALRRQEDSSALGLLGARPVWLDFCDAQYGCPPNIDDIADHLEKAIVSASQRTVFMPLGLFHSDHKIAHEAALRAMERLPKLSWFAYEDTLYRRVRGLLEERLRLLLDAGIVAVPAGHSSECGLEEKRRAVQEYRSQLKALSMPGYPGHGDLLEQERYWRLATRNRSAGTHLSKGHR